MNPVRESGNQVITNAATIPDTPSSEGAILPFFELKQFTYAELKAATRNFRGDSKIGEGGFGSVYKGWMMEKSLKPSKVGFGIEVAVKMLSQDSLQGHREWLVSLILKFGNECSVEFPLKGCMIIEGS